MKDIEKFIKQAQLELQQRITKTDEICDQLKKDCTGFSSKTLQIIFLIIKCILVVVFVWAIFNVDVILGRTQFIDTNLDSLLVRAAILSMCLYLSFRIYNNVIRILRLARVDYHVQNVKSIKTQINENLSNLINLADEAERLVFKDDNQKLTPKYNIDAGIAESLGIVEKYLSFRDNTIGIPMLIFHWVSGIFFSFVFLLLGAPFFTGKLSILLNINQYGLFSYICFLAFIVISIILLTVYPFHPGTVSKNQHTKKNPSSTKRYFTDPQTYLKKISKNDEPVKKRKIKKSFVFVAAVIVLLGYCLYVGWFAFLFNRHITINDDITTISEGEYAGKQLTSVDFPDSIISIEESAFRRNGLTSVDIPHSVASIGESAFANNLLITISIGSNVTLGTNAFGSKFEDFYNNNGMIAGTYMRHGSRSEDWSVWHSNYKLQFHSKAITIIDYNGDGGVIEIPAMISGYPVVAIGEKVFLDKKITSVTIPNSVTFIGASVFANNQLTSVAIPNSVTFIGVSAFSRNQLTSIAIGNSVTSIGENVFSYNRLVSVAIPNSVTSIGNHAFRGNVLTSVTISTSVTSIGGHAFSGNQLTSVTIPSSVTSIRDHAFSDNRLTSVIIPNRVTTIGNHAFRRNQLTSITIGNSVTSIGESAFSDNQLTSVNFPNSITTIGVDAFANNRVTNIRIGANVRLGSESSGSVGILGRGTGFNTAYANNGNRAGNYTRPNANVTTWTRR